jgi:arylsulfatase A-like enzyme
MNSRVRLGCLIAMLFAGFLVFTYAELPALIPPTKTRRHVLLFTVDTLRADYLGAYGYRRPTTPFLDSLMANGFRFSHARTPIPRTTPALSSLMTGCYPHTSQVRRLADRLPAQIVPAAELARWKGYVTVAVVSNPVLQNRGLNKGFDVYDGVDYLRDARETTDAVLRHLDGHAAGESLFVWAHYVDPHVPYYPPPELAVQFDHDYDGPYKTHFGGDDRRAMAYPADFPKPQGIYQNVLPKRVNAHIRRLYAAGIRHVDDQIARLMAGLRERFGDDWLIVFTADHGESLGEHSYFYEHGDYVYEPALHVPLAFVFPEGDQLHGTGVVDAEVSLVDVMPTLVDLLWLPRPLFLGYTIEGRSLTPAFRRTSLPPRPVFAECGHSFFPELVRRRVRFDVLGRLRAVVLGNWKLIWTPGRIGDDQFELYNLSTDPAETNNVYAGNRELAAPLSAALMAWLKAGSGDPPGVKQAALTPRDMEILRSLGYGS